MVQCRFCDLFGWHRDVPDLYDYCCKNANGANLLTRNVSLLKTSFVHLFFIYLDGDQHGLSFVGIPFAFNGMDVLSNFSGSLGRTGLP